jgi:PAS domain S-box-containing protein
MPGKKGKETQQELLYQLIKSEERYQNFMNAATDSIFINNLSGLILDANSAACNILGYTYKEITSLYVWDIEIGFSKETIKQIAMKLATGPFNVEGRHRRKDGTSFPVDVRMSAFSSMGESLVLAMVRDISEQKSAASTIRRLTYALEKIPLLVVITDKTGTIEYVNSKVAEHTGYFYYEIIGQNSRILKSGKMPNEIYQSMWDDLSNGKTWHGEFLNITKKREYYWVSATISPLRDETDKETTHYLAIMEPVFKHKYD